MTSRQEHYYESIGVLPPSLRGANGYRCYSQADVNRLNLLRRLRLLGISLAEARSLLTATLDAPCRDVQHELSHLVTAQLVVSLASLLREKFSRLTRRDQMDRVIEGLEEIEHFR